MGLTFVCDFHISPTLNYIIWNSATDLDADVLVSLRESQLMYRLSDEVEVGFFVMHKKVTAVTLYE